MITKIALPNKGRLERPATELFRQAGFRFERTERSLSVPLRDAPIELLFVRAKDVGELVSDGVADLGVTGLDMIAETGFSLDIALELGFGRCSLVAAVPEDSDVTGIEDMAGLRVATSHPSTVDRYFTAKGIEVTPIPLSGSVEVAPKLEIADAVADLVSTGSTMLVNGLRPIETLLESQAVLVEAAASDRSETAATVVTMLRAAMAARRKRYLVMNAPESAVGRIADIIPGMDAPTVVPLAVEGMVAIHSVVDAADVWHVLPRLEAADATGILVLPVQQVLA
jgi:ATP phosphoribosyltransferase